MSSQPAGHSLRGFSVTIGSASFGPAGSAGDSPRPIRDTAILTPGISIILRIASCSMRTDSSSEMLGARMMFGDTDPSFISGMKDVPRNGKRASVPRNNATERATVVRLWPSTQESNGR